MHILHAYTTAKSFFLVRMVFFAFLIVLVSMTKSSAQNRDAELKKSDTLVIGQPFPIKSNSYGLGKAEAKRLRSGTIRLIAFNMDDRSTSDTNFIDKYKDWNVQLIRIGSLRYQSEMQQTVYLLDEKGIILAKSTDTGYLDQFIAGYIRKRDYNIVEKSPK